LNHLPDHKYVNLEASDDIEMLLKSLERVEVKLGEMASDEDNED
jgi:hypothetical protein